MSGKYLAVTVLGLTACGCSYSSTTTQAGRPPPVAVAPATTTYIAPPPPTTTTVYTPALTVPYMPAATTPPAGVEGFRDEYGFRYDGQGNRIVRYGKIISPQSKIP